MAHFGIEIGAFLPLSRKSLCVRLNMLKHDRKIDSFIICFNQRLWETTIYANQNYYFGFA